MIFEVNMDRQREHVIVRTSTIGIVTNLLLVAFKMFVGLVSNSIAVILDAVNNLSDALSSVVTIIGAKLGARQPDRKHPLGYGRIEYLSSMTVAALVLYAGITSLVESVKKIIEPETADYSAVSIVIISVAIAVKLVLGMYVKRQGRKVNSGALVASGSDALFDAVLSASVLASAVIYLVWGISLEAYVGVVISGFIIKAGFEMMMETLNDLIGKREDPDTVRELKRIICGTEEVLGAYDVVLFNYGPDRNYGSVHIELPDNLSVSEVDRITRHVQQNVLAETGIMLTGISVYSHNTSNDEASVMRDNVQKKVMAHEWALQMHGFYVDAVLKTIRFDVVVSFDVDRKEAVSTICGEVKELYPDYEVTVVPDADVTDLEGAGSREEKK
ncbi:cation diffusion facilitator family transporter [Ruminococcaceae bacterium YRB3002]|nr:cation diffusion facilitator family transporter [Ruminococcaceae bacterium YRB3002]